MSEDGVELETTGETVGEAKWLALRELEKLHPGLDKSAVRFQVVTEGERGLLGVGYSPARVVARLDSAAAPVSAEPPPEDETESAAQLRALVVRVCEGLGIRCRIEVRDVDEDLTATCSGGDLGLLIGKHGQTIDAVQYLANAIVYRDRPDERKPVVVDASGYRARRRASLDALAVRGAERASSGSSVELEPMSAVERKIVHRRLEDFPGIVTRSEGTEPNRRVVIDPSGE